MDFTKLLKHCEAEHGIELDTSYFTNVILHAITRYFDSEHGKTLLHTEQWDILETLQERPKPGNPPPIVALMKGRAEENIKCGEPMESASWYSQEGVLLSNADALKIVEFCERANVVEQLPDYGTEWRPNWHEIDDWANFVFISKRGWVFISKESPEHGDWTCDIGNKTRSLIKIDPTTKWQNCIWERPKN